MKALILSADDFEDSELLVPYHRLKEQGLDVDIASLKRGKIRGKHSHTVDVDKTLGEVKPHEYDVLIVPGGKAPAAIRKDAMALEIAASIFRTNKPVAAICHGPQVLISAGLLKNRRATCHQSVAQELEEAGAVYEDAEVVVDGNLITSRKPSDLSAFMREIMRMLKLRWNEPEEAQVGRQAQKLLGFSATAGASMASSFQRILCPIDFDANSLGALQAAAEVARIAGGTVFVLHVVAPIASTPTQGLVDACLAEEQAVRERLTEIARTCLDGLSYEVLTRTGDPAIGIVHAEEELNADLVVIAIHAGRNTPRPFSGSIAERVIRESLCPVMTVRPSPIGDSDAVGSHMTANSLTASPDMTVAHVQQLMSENRCRTLPVIEGDKLVGLVTDRDLASSDATSDTAIGMLMTREVLTVSPRSSIQEAARLLVECEVEGLPVVEDQKLVGIITRSDILKAFSSLEPPPAHRFRSVLAKRTPTISRG